MACAWFVSLTLMAAAPVADSAETPTSDVSTPAPDPSWAEPHNGPDVSFEPIEVQKPRYGVGITEMNIRTKNDQYKVEVRKWNDIVREDPTLHHWHRQSRMLGGGIAMIVAGGLWLSISTAVTLDGHYTPSATTGLFAYVMPTAILASGGIMTIVALSARRKLLREQRRIYGSPYASASGGGLTLTGRF